VLAQGTLDGNLHVYCIEAPPGEDPNKKVLVKTRRKKDRRFL